MLQKDLEWLREIDGLAALGASVGRRGQRTRLRRELGREPVVEDFDLDDATIVVARVAHLMGRNLALPGDAAADVSPFDEDCRSPRSVRRRESAAREARVEIVEKYWEGKRRLRTGPGEHRLFVRGALWSAHANDVWSNPVSGHQVLLEHVVPASTVNVLLADVVRRHSEDLDALRCRREVVHLLRDVVRHVVLCRCEDSGHLDRTLHKQGAAVLRKHYSGEDPLSEGDLLRARWVRYLEPSRSGLTAFPMSSLLVP